MPSQPMGVSGHRFSVVERNFIAEKSHETLFHDDGKAALTYLIESRQLSPEVLKTFKIGYVPQYVNHLLSGRIIIPIYDPSNNLIALSSRRVPDQKSNIESVYWHEGYEKLLYVYGVNIAKTAMRRWRFCCICEGQIDVLQMHNHGMTNTVGLCGVSFSETQWAIVSRYCNEAVFILDSDKSGRTGAERATKLLDARPKIKGGGYRWYLTDYLNNVGSIEFSEVIDPDEFIRKYGMERLKAMIKAKILEMRRAEFRLN